MARQRTPSAFEQRVGAVVRAIPKGQVLSYAGVALRANRPGAARAVVRALHSLKDLPWWRVVRSDGTLAPAVAARQARRLRGEGVTLKRTGAGYRCTPDSAGSRRRPAGPSRARLQGAPER